MWRKKVGEIGRMASRKALSDLVLACQYLKYMALS